MKRSSIAQLKLCTRCGRCRMIGHWVRECPEGNRGQRNDERYDRHAERLEDGSKGFTAATGPTGEGHSLLEPAGESLRLTQEKFCGILAPKKDLSGATSRNGVENYSRNTVFSLNG